MFPIKKQNIKFNNSETGFLENYETETEIPLLPHPGAFSKVRKNHQHEGVDLYCKKGEEIFSIEDGIIVKIKPAALLDILDTVRIGLNFETATTISLKDPQMAIFSFKYKAGDLSYDDVLERNKKFQNLAIEYPDNKHYCKLRDFYMEFLAAYNFLNQKKLSEL